MGEESRAVMSNEQFEATSQILNMIHEDVKAVREEVRGQGVKLAVLDERVSQILNPKTNGDGVKIQIQTQGVWKKLLPYIILVAAASGGTGLATHFFGLI